MTQANDSINVTPGTGAVVATHLIGGKEYQVVLVAGPTGDIHGSKPTYSLVVPPQTCAANKVYFDLWNGSTSDIRVHRIDPIVKTDVSIIVTVGMELQGHRTSTVGTGGTTATYADSSVVGTIATLDTSNPALPVGVSARIVPTGGATSAGFLGMEYLSTDEASTAANLVNLMSMQSPAIDHEQPLILHQNQGYKIVQGTVTDVGSIGFKIYFTVG